MTHRPDARPDLEGLPTEEEPGQALADWDLPEES